MNCTGKRCLMQYNKVDPATCTAVPYCPQATPPKTNADRIRSMTDAEMAEWFGTRGHECPERWKACKIGIVDHEDDCIPCWLKWLREAVKDEHT